MPDIIRWEHVLGKCGKLALQAVIPQNLKIFEMATTNDNYLYFKIIKTGSDELDGKTMLGTVDVSSTNEGYPSIYNLDQPNMAVFFPKTEGIPLPKMAGQIEYSPSIELGSKDTNQKALKSCKDVVPVYKSNKEKFELDYKNNVNYILLCILIVMVVASLIVCIVLK